MPSSPKLLGTAMAGLGPCLPGPARVYHRRYLTPDCVRPGRIWSILYALIVLDTPQPPRASHRIRMSPSHASEAGLARLSCADGHVYESYPVPRRKKKHDGPQFSAHLWPLASVYAKQVYKSALERQLAGDLPWRRAPRQDKELHGLAFALLLQATLLSVQNPLNESHSASECWTARAFRGPHGDECELWVHGGDPPPASGVQTGQYKCTVLDQHYNNATSVVRGRMNVSLSPDHATEFPHDFHGYAQGSDRGDLTDPLPLPTSASLLEAEAYSKLRVSAATSRFRGRLESLFRGALGRMAVEQLESSALALLKWRLQQGVVPALAESITAQMSRSLPHRVLRPIVNQVAAAAAPRLAWEISEAAEVISANILPSRIASSLVPRLTSTLSARLIISLSRGLAKRLAGSLTRDLGHILCRSITHAVAASLLHALTQSPATDYFCYYCRKSQEYCQYCRHSPEQVYYAMYYAAYYSTHYCGYFALYHAESLAREDDEVDRNKAAEEQNRAVYRVLYGAGAGKNDDSTSGPKLPHKNIAFEGDFDPSFGPDAATAATRAAGDEPERTMDPNLMPIGTV